MKSKYNSLLIAGAVLIVILLAFKVIQKPAAPVRPVAICGK